MTAADYFTRVQASPGWARILDSFLRFVTPQPGWRALDVGCGPGALARRLAEMNCDALGVDADPDMIARAADLSRAQPRVQFRAGDALALPFSPPEAFDLVTATNLIFLLPDPLAGLKEMARVGKPGSVVAMLNPSPKLSRATAQAHADSLRLADFDAFSLTNWGAIAETHRRFTETDLRLMFAEVGLQSVEIVEKIGPGLALFAKGIK